ncbi:Oidioi.mRNA.OKI2018_I69.chr2.g4877.t1.cds [Oikopleura dioica]|uniref:Oidioi.mRNA.OKI2018_I69.chr2.g4877.t1.cds n=1 Tax=Oikopleura dioica TaxID=34765 RepID=A0ABN7T2Z9_OIKDI|nr:Oidioi.mRNA.OKI2018_I69.chr2.g4877.t1.cds [Oikopleura dioica]
MKAVEILFTNTEWGEIIAKKFEDASISKEKAIELIEKHLLSINEIEETLLGNIADFMIKEQLDFVPETDAIECLNAAMKKFTQMQEKIINIKKQITEETTKQ